jgi:hypothetical protein
MGENEKSEGNARLLVIQQIEASDARRTRFLAFQVADCQIKG